MIPIMANVSDDDEELEMLRAAALRSKRIVPDDSVCSAQNSEINDIQRIEAVERIPVSHASVSQNMKHMGKMQHGHSRFQNNRAGFSREPRSNLIVIQTVPLDGDAPQASKSFQSSRTVQPFTQQKANVAPLLLRPQDKWDQPDTSLPSKAKVPATKFSRYNNNSDSSSDSDSDEGDANEDSSSNSDADNRDTSAVPTSVDDAKSSVVSSTVIFNCIEDVTLPTNDISDFDAPEEVSLALPPTTSHVELTSKESIPEENSQGQVACSVIAVNEQNLPEVAVCSVPVDNRQRSPAVCSVPVDNGQRSPSAQSDLPEVAVCSVPVDNRQRSPSAQFDLPEVAVCSVPVDNRQRSPSAQSDLTEESSLSRSPTPIRSPLRLIGQPRLTLNRNRSPMRHETRRFDPSNHRFSSTKTADRNGSWSPRLFVRSPTKNQSRLSPHNRRSRSPNQRHQSPFRQFSRVSSKANFRSRSRSPLKNNTRLSPKATRGSRSKSPCYNERLSVKCQPKFSSKEDSRNRSQSPSYRRHSKSPDAFQSRLHMSRAREVRSRSPCLRSSPKLGDRCSSRSPVNKIHTKSPVKYLQRSPETSRKSRSPDNRVLSSPRSYPAGVLLNHSRQDKQKLSSEKLRSQSPEKMGWPHLNRPSRSRSRSRSNSMERNQRYLVKSDKGIHNRLGINSFPEKRERSKSTERRSRSKSIDKMEFLQSGKCKKSQSRSRSWSTERSKQVNKSEMSRSPVHKRTKFMTKNGRLTEKSESSTSYRKSPNRLGSGLPLTTVKYGNANFRSADGLPNRLSKNNVSRSRMSRSPEKSGKFSDSSLPFKSVLSENANFRHKSNSFERRTYPRGNDELRKSSTVVTAKHKSEKTRTKKSFVASRDSPSAVSELKSVGLGPVKLQGNEKLTRHNKSKSDNVMAVEQLFNSTYPEVLEYSSLHSTHAGQGKVETASKNYRRLNPEIITKRNESPMVTNKTFVGDVYSMQKLESNRQQQDSGHEKSKKNAYKDIKIKDMVTPALLADVDYDELEQPMCNKRVTQVMNNDNEDKIFSDISDLESDSLLSPNKSLSNLSDSDDEEETVPRQKHIIERQNIVKSTAINCGNQKAIQQKKEQKCNRKDFPKADVRKCFSKVSNVSHERESAIVKSVLSIVKVSSARKRHADIRTDSNTSSKLNTPVFIDNADQLCKDSAKNSIEEQDLVDKRICKEKKDANPEYQQSDKFLTSGDAIKPRASVHSRLGAPPTTAKDGEPVMADKRLARFGGVCESNTVVNQVPVTDLRNRIRRQDKDVVDVMRPEDNIHVQRRHRKNSFRKQKQNASKNIASS